MRVTFTKVGGRRYALDIEREHGPQLVSRFAPGYDDLMPHDLAHFLVEEQFGIELGVFGQLAAGGTGVFRPAPDDDHARVRRGARRIATVGRADMARSEQLVVLAVGEWERSSSRHEHQRRDVPVELEPEQLPAIVQRLADVSQRWRALQPGGSLTFEWPGRLTFDAARSRRGRRPERKHPHAARR